MWGEFCKVYAPNAEKDSNKKISHKYTQEVVCPYCGNEFTDSWEYDDSEEIYCESCKNTFDMERAIEVTYCTYKKKK